MNAYKIVFFFNFYFLFLNFMIDLIKARSCCIMCYFYLYDCVANAIIERNRICGEKNILLEDAINYERKVVQLLQENGYFAKMKVIDEKSILFFEKEYEDYFVSYYEGDKKGYSLKEDKTIEELIKLFRGNMEVGMLSFFSDICAIRQLNLEKYCNFSMKYKQYPVVSTCDVSNCKKRVLVKEEAE